jgi:hypothetical protein
VPTLSPPEVELGSSRGVATVKEVSPSLTPRRKSAEPAGFEMVL